MGSASAEGASLSLEAQKFSEEDLQNPLRLGNMNSGRKGLSAFESQNHFVVVVVSGLPANLRASMVIAGEVF